MAQVYASYPVPSIHSFHTDLPDELAARFSLSASLEVDDPVTPANVKDAERAIQMLEVWRNEEPTITEAVIQTAKDRAHSLHTITSQNKFPNPTDLVEIMAALRRIEEGQRKLEEGQRKLEEGQRKIENDLKEVKRTVENARAEQNAGFHLVDFKQDNLRIIAINGGQQKNIPPVEYMFRKKVVAGDGRELAQGVASSSTRLPVKESPELGSVWKEELVDTSNLSLVQVLDIVRFYNQTFGIVSRDTLAARIVKINAWLIGAGPL